ncbi:cuticle protein 16.5-like [Ochlerotatus camptorhynchus]|uniref:cuticle protein 16.5-like n=1 Tax=Ochlerotatus camptorhynchus TaxID=644619 RepID=UPI0031DE356E
MFKFAVLIASLAYASAGTEHSVPYATPAAAHYLSAPAVSYNTFTRHQYAAPAHHGYAHAAPVLAAPNHVYTTTPFTRTYGTPALSYGHSYAPSLSHDNYGYSSYADPLSTKTLAVAQPQLYHQNTYATHAVAAPVLATHGFNYAPVSAGAHLLGYNNHHGQYAY